VLPEVVDASAPSTLYLRDLNMFVNLARTVPHPGGLRAALQTDGFHSANRDTAAVSDRFRGARGDAAIAVRHHDRLLRLGGDQ
jgi:hypothetical protein